VVATSAKTLIHQGSPYRSSRALAATTDPNQYNPYLPLMAAFGVPQALLGHGLLTDPRVWFGVVFLVVFAFALRIAGPGRCPVGAADDGVASYRVRALRGRTDVPMVAFLCLGFALLWRGRGPGGPGVPGSGVQPGRRRPGAWHCLGDEGHRVARARGGVRDALRPGWPGRRMAVHAVALAVVAVIVGPFAVLRPGSLVKNTILFRSAWPASSRRRPVRCSVTCWRRPAWSSYRGGHPADRSGWPSRCRLCPPARDVPAATIRLVIGLSPCSCSRRRPGSATSSTRPRWCSGCSCQGRRQGADQAEPAGPAPGRAPVAAGPASPRQATTPRVPASPRPRVPASRVPRPASRVPRPRVPRPASRVPASPRPLGRPAGAPPTCPSARSSRM